MQEKTVTINGKLHRLEEPFFVLATQNPIEQEGTYPLPEAQLDRFMYNLILDYPKFEDELQVIKNTTTENKVSLRKVLHASEILQFQQLVRRIPIADNVVEYAVKLVSKTRPDSSFATTEVKEFISYGAGPRAGQFLVIGAKCNAVLKGKLSPDIDDVKAVAVNVLRHRLIKNYKAEAEGMKIEKIIQGLL
jgi:MoxR-like ATPase